MRLGSQRGVDNGKRLQHLGSRCSISLHFVGALLGVCTNTHLSCLGTRGLTSNRCRPNLHGNSHVFPLLPRTDCTAAVSRNNWTVTSQPVSATCAVRSQLVLSIHFQVRPLSATAKIICGQLFSQVTTSNLKNVLPNVTADSRFNNPKQFLGRHSTLEIVQRSRPSAHPCARVCFREIPRAAWVG